MVMLLLVTALYEHAWNVEVCLKLFTNCSQMAKESCAFHHCHGLNIRLLEDGNVALRVNSHDNGIVFSQQPIPNEYMFQVEVVRLNDKGYPESLVSDPCV